MLEESFRDPSKFNAALKDEDLMSFIDYCACICFSALPKNHRDHQSFLDVRQAAMISLWKFVLNPKKQFVPDGIIPFCLVVMKRGAFRQFFVRSKTPDKDGRKYRYRAYEFDSLDAPVHGTELKLMDVAGPSCMPDDPFRNEMFDYVMSELPERDRNLLYERFVLDEKMEDMAKRRNVTKQAVFHSLKKLKPKLRALIHKYKSPRL